MEHKIGIKNIYYMLSYAYQNLNEAGFRDIAVEEFTNIHDMFASILLRGVSNQVKRGLYKAYIAETEFTSSLRGKIDTNASIKQLTMLTRRMVCQYDTFCEDTPLNRILKLTIKILVQHGDIKTDTKKGLRKLLLYFQGVTNVDPLTINWGAVRYHRNNATYKMLINVCWLVVKGLLLTTKNGQHHLSTFLDDQKMHRLYEKFVLNYFKKEFPQYSASASFIDWDIDKNVGKTQLPAMKSDITLSDGTSTLIIDTKYYGHTMQVNAFYNSTTFISANIYQIYAYVKNKDKEAIGNVSGLLLYAKTNEGITPDADLIIGGNRFGVKTLDLGAEWATIRSQLDQLPEQYLGRK